MRREQVDLRNELNELKGRMAVQEQETRNTYVRRDLLDEKLDAIIFRLINVETYMRKITQ